MPISKKPDPDYRFRHGDHNLKVAESLLTNKSISAHDPWDWIVTTSFYAAVHFVEAVIESGKPPLKYYREPVKIRSSTELKGEIINGQVNHSEHTIRLQLMNENFHEVSTGFTDLFQASCTARYTDYKAYDHALAEQFHDIATTEIRVWAKNILWPSSKV